LKVLKIEYVPLVLIAQKVFIEENCDVEIELIGSHEQQVALAEGICRIRELVDDSIERNFRLAFREELQEFNRRVIEIRSKKGVDSLL
jgi:hypothetical protein